ncbi:MaoC family dehydratase [Altererythrobacter sp.]|uniref:MaoC family dehydratase n=1 Tax=Altererythrobacter sp. TaxID=1872480 RepID=UPI003D06EF2D
MPIVVPSELDDWIDREIGVSGWTTIAQERIDAFAQVTEDWQFIHVDPDKARESFFGGTIAHGFLTLSLLSKFAFEAGIEVKGTRLAINYGFDKVRMLSPVPSRSRIRGRLVLGSLDWKSPSRVLLGYDTIVEIEGSDKPALFAHWLCMLELESHATACSILMQHDELARQ